MAKLLIILSILFLTLSAGFGVLNTTNTRSLRELTEKTETARAQAEQRRLASEKEIKTRDAAAAASATKASNTESKVASSEADLIRSQTEKSELQAKLRENQTQMTEMQARLEEMSAKEHMPDALPMPGAGDLQAQLEDTRRQLDSAEREKQLLSDRIQKTENRAAQGPQQRVARAPKPGIRGTVLAVNQAYNFVVLNLGNRQGVEANTEMLVLRGGTPIGKIRVSSVEPATAIGDIVSSSLARGVQVQPGDIVVYAGSSS